MIFSSIRYLPESSFSIYPFTVYECSFQRLWMTTTMTRNSPIIIEYCYFKSLTLNFFKVVQNTYEKRQDSQPGGQPVSVKYLVKIWHFQPYPPGSAGYPGSPGSQTQIDPIIHPQMVYTLAHDFIIITYEVLHLCIEQSCLQNYQPDLILLNVGKQGIYFHPQLTTSHKMPPPN